MHDSSAPGFLAPTGAPVPYDDALDDALHDILAGIGGYTDPAMLRPRWQPEPPNQPDFADDWLAFGVVRTDPDTFMWEGHDPAGDGGAGQDVAELSELVDVLMSFYGPRAQGFCEILRMGLQIEQNRAALNVLHMDVVAVGAPIIVPALLKNRWVRRVDATVTLRRRVQRTYAVRNLLSLADPVPQALAGSTLSIVIKT